MRIFEDVSFLFYFQVFGTLGMTFVRRCIGKEYHPDCVVSTVKHGGGSIMIWGFMAADGISEMFLCKGCMNSQKYINVLETVMMPLLMRIFGDTNVCGVNFQQDNASCHKSAIKMCWFKDSNIVLQDWPMQSPDLNPIEHFWGILKHNIREHSITSKTALKNALIQEWGAISAETCTSLVCSKPRGLLLLLKPMVGLLNVDFFL